MCLLRLLSVDLLGQTEVANFTNTSLEPSTTLLLSLLEQLVHFGSDDELELFELLRFYELGKRFEGPDVEEDHPVVAEAAHFAFSDH